jgi:hypothetical protein
MHPSYDPHQHRIDGANAGLAAVALKARSTGAPPDNAELRAYVAGNESSTWYSSEREQLLASLSGGGPGGDRPSPGAGSSPPPPSPPAEPPGASISLAPSRLGVPGLHGADEPGLLGLRSAVDEARWTDAIPGCVSATPGEGDGARWAAHLAELCARAGMIAQAEQRLAVAAASPDERSARNAILVARQRYGVAPGQPNRPPDVEAARARAWFEVRAALDTGQLDGAEEQLTRALRRFAGDAGMLSLHCEVAVRRDSPAVSPVARCERALKAWKDLPHALYWSALAQANHGDRGLALTRLHRSKTLDPSFDAAWKALADLYRIEGKQGELNTLRAEYRAQFGRPLR